MPIAVRLIAGTCANAMRAITTRIVGIVALFAAVALCDRAEGAPVLVPPAIIAAHENLSFTDKIQFMYDGRPYCWYRYGWAGPGWYWCGYGTRFGFGWGGAYGWNGWEVPRGSRSLRVVPRYRRYR